MGRVARQRLPRERFADPDGRVVRLMGMGLSDLREGRYDLVLLIRDETNGAQIERSEPFTVVPAS